MRPEILNPLFAESDVLKGVGPQIAKLLKKLGLTRVIDVLYHLPTGSIERVRAPAASAGLLGRNVILDLKPFEIRESRSGRGPTRIFASDGDGNSISLIYFNNPGWARRSLPMGQARTVSGKLEAYGDEWQIIHPEVSEPGKGVSPLLREPVYPLTEGLTNRRIAELAREALERAPELPEWIEPTLAAREAWREWRSSLAEAHREPGADGARRRLAYDEIFANQLALLLLLLDQRHLVFRRRLREKIVHPRFSGFDAAVNGLSPVIITVRIPIARRSANFSRMPPLTTSFRWTTPNAFDRSATTSGVPPDRAIASTMARSSGATRPPWLAT